MPCLHCVSALREKHKAATQWVDYKLGLSFKQTEFINIEFPHTQLAGPSLRAYYCGSNTDEAYPCTLMHLCVCLRLHWVCTYLCAFLVCFNTSEQVLTGCFLLLVLPDNLHHNTFVCAGMMASSSAPWWGDLWLPCCIEARERGRPGSSMSRPRTTSAWIPIMCQLFRMRSNCNVGKDPHGPQRCGFPQPWAHRQALPHTASLTHLPPPNGTPPHIQAHRYASAPDPHHPPNSSTHYHQSSVPHSKGGTG